MKPQPTPKHPKSADRCIFCLSTGKLTGEHVWADWLRDFLPRPGTKNSHHTRVGDEDIKPGKMNRAGDAHSQKLVVVCRACNSGWMSKLQTAAKPILIPLIQDKWPHLDEKNQKILTKWAMMFTMVVEFADPATQMIPQSDRNTIRIGDIPSSWSIWIGRHNPGIFHPAYFNQFGRRDGYQLLAAGIPLGLQIGRAHV